ncbi:MAG: hypothetical protein JXM79_17330 [Sedimentisphaerales bacterium]|nr:hypothetical protein [Sedimentisphaerales bacterium]
MMKIAKEPGVLLRALKDHEQALARLYDVYAETFPECKELWMQLAREEIQHAHWLDKLQAGIEDSSEDFIVERFSIATIEHSIGYVTQLISRAQQADFTLINALSIALQLEKALIENKYFEVFEGDSGNTRRTLDLLAQCTQAHYEKLQKAWREHGGGRSTV